MASRAEYIQQFRSMRAQGLSKDEIISKLGAPPPRTEQTPAGPAPAPTQRQPEQPSKFRSALEGAGQGVSLGFADELQGLIGALGGSFAEATRGMSFADRYKLARDVARESAQRAEQANPGYFTGAQIGGAILPAVLTGGAATSARGALATAAGEGAAAGLGESEADLTEGEFGQALADTATGAALGTAGAATGQALLKGGRAAIRGLSGKKRIAQELAEGRGRASVLSGQGATHGALEQAAIEAEQDIIKDTGDLGFRFSRGQRTADSGELMKERALGQYKETMHRMQSAQRERLSTVGRYVKQIVDKVSDNPDLLDDDTVGANAANAVKRRINELVDRRAQTSRPLFEAIDEASGIPFDTSNSTKVLSQLSRESDWMHNDDFGRAVAKSIKKLGAGEGAGSGKISFAQAQDALSFWGAAARGERDVFQGLSKAAAKRQSKRVYKALLADLDAAVKNPDSAEVAEKLVAARQSWAQGSDEISKLNNSVTKRILKIADDDPGAIVPMLMKKSTAQQRNTMRIIEQADPAAAKQVRAQILNNIFAQGSLGETGEFLGEQALSAGASAAKARGAMLKNRKTIEALFGGDQQTVNKLQTAFRALDRLSLTPGLQGSQTAGTLLSIGDALKEANRIGVVGALSNKGREVLARITEKTGNKLGLSLSREDLAKLASSPEDIDAIYELTNALSKRKSDKAIGKASVALGNVINILAGDEEQEPTDAK